MSDFRHTFNGNVTFNVSLYILLVEASYEIVEKPDVGPKTGKVPLLGSHPHCAFTIIIMNNDSYPH